MQCYAAPRDYTLLEEQGDGDFVLLVLTGKVGLVKVVLRHSVKQIAEVGAGASLGELSLIDGRPRFASCITMEPTDFAVLTRHSLQRTSDSLPATCQQTFTRSDANYDSAYA